MRTCKKRSERRNALSGVLLQLERCEKYGRPIRSEGFSDSVYFYHTILQNVRDLTEKRLTSTVSEHRVHCTHLAKCTSTWVYEKGHFCEIYNTSCRALEKKKAPEFLLLDGKDLHVSSRQ